MKKIRKSKIIYIFLFGIISSIFYIFLYMNVDNCLTSDDAASQLYFYENQVYGVGLAKGVILRSFQISNILARIGYLIFGADVGFTWFQNGVRYFILIVLSFRLACIRHEKYENIVEWWLVPLFSVFTVFQNPLGTDYGLNAARFHLDSIICLLIFLVILEKKGEYSKKRYYFFISLIFIITLLQIDFVFIPAFVIPFFWWGICYGVSTNKKGQIIGIGSFVFVCLAFLLKIINVIYGIDVLYNGYGSSVMPNLSNIINNIIPLLNAYLSMCGIEYAGMQFFSINFFITIPRMIVFVIMLGVWVKTLFEVMFLRKNIDSVSSVVSVSIFMLFIFSILFCDISSPVTARYMGGTLYLMPIVLCRRCKDLKLLQVVKTDNNHLGIFVATALICLIGVKVPLNSSINVEYQKLAEYLEENNYKYGVGDFWTANISSLLTKQKTLIQAVYLDKNYGLLYPYMDEWAYYDDKTNQFNFIVIDKNESLRMGGDIEDYFKMYGTPIENNMIDGNCVLKYDYDIRYKPIYSYLESGSNHNGRFIEKKSENEYLSHNNSVSMGKYRLIIWGTNLQTCKLDIMDDNVIIKECIYNEDAIICEFISKRCSDELQVSISGNEEFSIQKQMMVCLLPSYEVEISCMEDSLKTETLDLEEGEYQLIVKGKDISELHLQSSDQKINDGIIAKYRGEESYLYQIDCKEAISLNFEIKGKIENIDGVYLVQEHENNSSYYDFSTVSLQTTGSINESGNIQLLNDEIQYGPYITLEKGTYHVHIKGSNLGEDVSVNVGYEIDEVLDIHNLEVSSDSIDYDIFLDEDKEQVEFRTFNNGENKVEIENVIVEEVSYE